MMVPDKSYRLAEALKILDMGADSFRWLIDSAGKTVVEDYEGPGWLRLTVPDLLRLHLLRTLMLYGVDARSGAGIAARAVASKRFLGRYRKAPVRAWAAAFQPDALVVARDVDGEWRGNLEPAGAPMGASLPVAAVVVLLRPLVEEALRRVESFEREQMKKSG